MTPEQITTLRAAIAADANLVALRAAKDTQGICDYLNGPTAGFVLWQTAVPIQTVYDSITWANLTPADAPDGTATWTNRALCCQGKQFNIQTMLQGRDSINATKANVRAGLQDGLTQIPSGVSGANRSAGWTTLQTAMQRLATVAEKVFATGTGTTGSPAIPSFEGLVQVGEVNAACFSDSGVWRVG